MYTPDRLREGQIILFNNPLPVQGPKAIVRWVTEYRITGRFYKTGIMFSRHAEEDSDRASRCEQGDLEDPSPGGVEKSSPLIKSCSLAFSGGNYRVASSDDFWSNLAELSEKEADQFIALTSEVMRHETMKDDVSLRFLRAIAFFGKARIIFRRQGEHWDDNTLDLVEKSLIDFRAADELAGHCNGFPYIALEENRDAAAKALESERPGRAQEILGKTKLGYMGDRLFLRNRHYAPSAEEMAIFENIFFHSPHIVRSAAIFYKVLGEPGKRYINVFMYKETSPWNSAGEENDPLCIIGLVEDGTFHLIKDLAAGGAKAEVGEEEAEDSRPLYEEQISQEGRGMQTAWETTDREVHGDSDERKRSPEALVVVTSRTGGGRDRKKMNLLIACAVLLFLMITPFFLKSYPPKPVAEPKKEVIPRPNAMLTQETAEHPYLPSEPPENRPITRKPESSGKAKGHESRRATAEGVARKKKTQEMGTNADRRMKTSTGKTAAIPPPEIKKRSFPPHSRDDL